MATMKRYIKGWRTDDKLDTQHIKKTLNFDGFKPPIGLSPSYDRLEWAAKKHAELAQKWRKEIIRFLNQIGLSYEHKESALWGFGFFEVTGSEENFTLLFLGADTVLYQIQTQVQHLQDQEEAVERSIKFLNDRHHVK